MLGRIWSSAIHGIGALPISVEAHVYGAQTRYSVLGLPDASVREALGRILSSFRNSGYGLPRGALTINLAPSDIRKEGAAFDLPMALAVLVANGVIPQHRVDGITVLGELSLDGHIQPVRGVLSAAVNALKEGRLTMIVPNENVMEAALVDGMTVLSSSSLRNVAEYLAERGPDLKRLTGPIRVPPEKLRTVDLDFSDVKGQGHVKRAMEIAAAGGHNALLVGPPGAGKTMLARRLPGILPPFSFDEAIETTKIYSVAGLLGSAKSLVRDRPFRAPHHTVSDAGLCGGGANPRPGEISLSHNGLLFLDELPEFSRKALEVLRQPLEEGMISISRARGTFRYPANFMLVGSMNPCPCGYLTDPIRECECIPNAVQRYLSRISGPLMDRIDLHIEVTPVPFDELSSKSSGERSADIRQRVLEARDLQASRFQGQDGVSTNSDMGTRLVRLHCRIGEESRVIIKAAVDRLGLSARAFDRILKVSRTIADLAGEPDIQATHVAEAIQYRSLDRRSWQSSAVSGSGKPAAASSAQKPKPTRSRGPNRPNGAPLSPA